LAKSRNSTKCVRFNENEIDVIEKVKKSLNFQSDSDTIRFIINVWWGSMGAGAVDMKKLAKLIITQMVKTDETQAPKIKSTG